VLLPSINNLLVHEHVEEKLIAWTADLLDFTDKTFFFVSVSPPLSFKILILFSIIIFNIIIIHCFVYSYAGDTADTSGSEQKNLSSPSSVSR